MVANRRTPPPPLQLEDDNTRYGRHLLLSRVVEKDSIFARVYEKDWRTFIIIATSVNLILYLFSALQAAISLSELEEIEDAVHSRKRTAVFLAVGLTYVGTALVELFGLVSTVMRRLVLIRVYVHMAFASALVVTGAGVLVSYAYFEFAEDVVSQCVSIANTGKIVVKLLYRHAPQSPHKAIFTAEDAQRQCFNAWSAESSSQIIYVFVSYFLPSAFTCLLVYTYYRQCTDPYHQATMCSQMAAGNDRRPYTRVSRATGSVSPYFSPFYLNVVVHRPGANSPNDGRGGDSRSSARSSNRLRRSGPSARNSYSFSGKRSARRARVNWFARSHGRVSLNSSSSAATVSPGPPSFGGGHLG
jgi:uncharacterized membrane protein YgcG